MQTRVSNNAHGNQEEGHHGVGDMLDDAACSHPVVAPILPDVDAVLCKVVATHVANKVIARRALCMPIDKEQTNISNHIV